uniref:Uncharacterized protein n=1 Tax=Salix viminalis TaxID=40686 RepID=A0A6N2M1G2_SALVM
MELQDIKTTTGETEFLSNRFTFRRYITNTPKVFDYRFPDPTPETAEFRHNLFGLTDLRLQFWTFLSQCKHSFSMIRLERLCLHQFLKLDQSLAPPRATDPGWAHGTMVNGGTQKIMCNTVIRFFLEVEF